jgi:hypothetical protein
VSPDILSGTGLSTKDDVERFGGVKMRAGEGAAVWYS